MRYDEIGSELETFPLALQLQLRCAELSSGSGRYNDGSAGGQR